MSSDTSTARNVTVEDGLHSSSTSQNTTEMTHGNEPPMTSSRWNQRRNKIVVSLTVMTVSIALSVGVFVSSRGNKNDKQANPLKATGGHDTAIIAELSSTKSEHMVCNTMFVAGAEDLHDLYAPQPDSSSAKIAIDSKNLVVVSRGTLQYGYDKFNVYVEFYSLKDNYWKKVIGFQEEDVDDFKWEHGQRSVALSGKTAVVIFPSDDAFDRPVFTYRQIESGLWEKVTTDLQDGRS